LVTLLVVDDEFGVIELLAQVLEDEGHYVVSAGTGKQALARLAESPPDLIMLDFMMPVMDGPSFLLAAADEVRRRRIPVVMMSSLPETAIAERVADYAGFLRKPFRMRDAVMMVRSLLPPEDDAPA
jgi:CheY-like chemotaxis protein